MDSTSLKKSLLLTVCPSIYQGKTHLNSISVIVFAPPPLFLIITSYTMVLLPTFNIKNTLKNTFCIHIMLTNHLQTDIFLKNDRQVSHKKKHPNELYMKKSYTSTPFFPTVGRCSMSMHFFSTTLQFPGSLHYQWHPLHWHILS